MKAYKLIDRIDESQSLLKGGLFSYSIKKACSEDFGKESQSLLKGGLFSYRYYLAGLVLPTRSQSLLKGGLFSYLNENINIDTIPGRNPF